jgi:predicted nucleotidyltransferase component of viral defense system
MHNAVNTMLKKYNCQSQQDYVNAIKEIFQEIALLGLWRAKFFEKAAFYGGSALRILYGLDRFSEDLDFSLLTHNPSFTLTSYNNAIIKELAAFGFEATMDIKQKSNPSAIESAFIKALSSKQLLIIEAPKDIVELTHHMQTIKIKMEVDTAPPGLFSTETQFLLQPIPFSVKSYTKPCLFAGKIHALLCRPWVKRVKGRDWYDFAWYLANNIPVNLPHLTQRLVQSQALTTTDTFALQDLIALINKKIEQTDFAIAKKDILPFINDPAQVALWSADFFKTITQQRLQTATD